MRIRASEKKGYTFTEIMVVLAIIAVMLAILVPRLAFQQKGAGLKGAASEILSTLRAARRMAIAERIYRSVAVAFDIYSVPAEFVIMAEPRENEFFTIDEKPRRLPDNIAIVAVNEPGWSRLDVTRTDDVDLDGDDESPTDPGKAELPTSGRIYNPERLPGSMIYGRNQRVNSIYRMIRFRPTGTADGTLLYLWNIEDDRTPLPNPSAGQTRSNLHIIGIPPGLRVAVPTNNQRQYFEVINEASPDDAYYYTIEVNSITGNVTVYDYAYGYGGSQWDRKKDGE